MIVHLIRFGFRDETTEEQKAEVLAVLERRSAIESVLFATVGLSLANIDEGLTHAYLVCVEDLAALERYLHDPVHLAGDPQIVPHFAKVAAGPDISDELDLGLREEIKALHEAKLAKYPDFAELLDTVPEVIIL
jgi:Stress responsive A/B Barrel Domain